MKTKFLLQAGKFVGIIVLLILFLIVLSELSLTKTLIADITNTTDYIENITDPEIIPFIEKVSEDNAKTKLILGDSVCRRLFEPFEEYNPDYCIAGTNRGVGMPGQYILAKSFLESHPYATEIDLVLTTNSIITGYENLYGYQYSTKPFLETNTLSLLDPDTLKEMRSSYGFFATNKTMVRIVDKSPVLKKAYLNLLNQYNAIYVLPQIPEVVEKYIIKIKELCDDRGVVLYVISSPISDSDERRQLEKIISESYRQTELQEYFPNFYDNLFYYSPDLFVDGIHPTEDQRTLCIMVHNMMEANDCMSDFVLPY